MTKLHKKQLSLTVTAQRKAAMLLSQEGQRISNCTAKAYSHVFTLQIGIARAFWQNVGQLRVPSH